MPISTFLNGRPPTQLRGLAFLALSEAATIEARTAVSDGGGGASWTWAAAGSAPCRVYPVTTKGQGRITGGQIDERTTHYCVLPTGTPVNQAERIVIANRGTFEVTMVLQRTSRLTNVCEVMQLSEF
jgi:hypothetical protein